jgi:hypothetical protein
MTDLSGMEVETFICGLIICVAIFIALVTEKWHKR